MGRAALFGKPRVEYEVLSKRPHEVVGHAGTLEGAKKIAYDLTDSSFRKRWKESGTFQYRQWFNDDLSYYIRTPQTEETKKLFSPAASLPVAASDRPWRVRDTSTNHRYYFDTSKEADDFITDVATSEITGEPLRQWERRLVRERNER